jgi:hypothetical protein
MYEKIRFDIITGFQRESDRSAGSPDRAVGIYHTQGRYRKGQENRNQGVRQLRDAGV